MLRDLEEEERVEVGSVGRVEMTAMTVGLESDRDPPPLLEMETSGGMGHLGWEEGLDDEMHFAIRRLFAEDDVSKGINDFPPLSSSSISPNLPLVLYHNPDKFLSKLIKTIRVHSVGTGFPRVKFCKFY